MSLAESLVVERGSISLLAHTLDPEYKLYRHTVAVNRFVQRIMLKPNGRGIITMQPRVGKSEAASRRGPLFYLDWMPTARIILASYGAELAVDNGRWIRNQIEQNPDKLRVRLSEDSKKAGQWNTPQGGGVLAAGVGGAMTGFGADLMVLDDLFKNWQEAHSQVQRDRVWDWYRSVARLRLQTNGSIVCAMTRWHRDDLIGRLLAHDEDAGRWEILNLPALAEDDDPLGREPGEVLCPAMFSEADVIEQMEDLGPHLSAALLQQHPSAPEGEMFLRSKWDFADAAPGKPTAAVRFWDLAATAGGGDETAGVLVALDGSGAYVVDVVHGRWSSAEVESVIAQTAELDAGRWGKQGVVQMVEEEGGASGKSRAETLVNEVLVNFPAEAHRSTGKKEVRAQSVAARQQAGRLFIVRREDGTAPTWAGHLIDQAAEFPHGTHDDIVDALSNGYNHAAERARKTRKSKGSARSVATQGR